MLDRTCLLLLIALALVPVTALARPDHNRPGPGHVRPGRDRGAMVLRPGAVTVTPGHGKAKVVVHGARGRGQLRAHLGPPALRVEVQPARPSHRHVWVPGYWKWKRGAHVWVAGGWRKAPKPHQLWIEPRWVQVDDGWELQQGRWQAAPPQPVPSGAVLGVLGSAQGSPFASGLADVGDTTAGGLTITGPVVTIAPPAPQAETPPPPPSPKHVWIAGHWAPQKKTFLWLPGRWQLGPPGHAWVPTGWQSEGLHGWRLVPGRWIRR